MAEVENSHLIDHIGLSRNKNLHIHTNILYNSTDPNNFTPYPSFTIHTIQPPPKEDYSSSSSSRLNISNSDSSSSQTPPQQGFQTVLASPLPLISSTFSTPTSGSQIHKPIASKPSPKRAHPNNSTHGIPSTQISLPSGNPFITISDKHNNFKPLTKEFLPNSFSSVSFPTLHFSTPLSPTYTINRPHYSLSPFIPIENDTVFVPCTTTNNNVPTKKKKSQGYCECCNTEFETLKTHLESKEHRGFAEKDRNYSKIDSIIIGLPLKI
eukprot:gene13385-15744_t